MDIKMISSVLVVASIVASIVVFVYLKVKKQLVEKAFVYGLVGALSAQIMSIFVLADTSLFSLIVNALFLSLVFYNVVMLFGIRFSKMHESNKAFYSVYCGLGVVGNLLNVFFFGLSGLMVNVYSQNEELVEAVGKDVMDALVDGVSRALSEDLLVLVASLIASFFISYFTLKLFAHAYSKKLIKTNFKALLMLFAYYAVGVFIPTNAMQTNLQIVLYGAVVLAAYLIYKQSKNDQPSVVIKVIK